MPGAVHGQRGATRSGGQEAVEEGYLGSPGHSDQRGYNKKGPATRLWGHGHQGHLPAPCPAVLCSGWSHLLRRSPGAGAEGLPGGSGADLIQLCSLTCPSPMGVGLFCCPVPRLLSRQVRIRALVQGWVLEAGDMEKPMAAALPASTISHPGKVQRRQIWEGDGEAEPSWWAAGRTGAPLPGPGSGHKECTTSPS